MKWLFFLFILNFKIFGYSQTDKVSLFAQCKFDIKDQKELKILENKIRQNPNVKVVRLDFVSQRSFILTQNLSELTEDQFVSWFENFSDSVKCIQIGVYGVDKINPYPFSNCLNEK